MICFEEKIYLSYNRQDLPVAEWIIKNLELNGFPVYTDRDDLAFGIDYASTTLRAINNSRLVIAIISNNALNSQWVAKELVIASKSNKKILAILTDNVSVEDIPESIQYSSLAYLSKLRNHHDELLNILQKLENGTYRDFSAQPPKIASPKYFPSEVEPLSTAKRGPHRTRRVIVCLSISAIIIGCVVGLLMKSMGLLSECCAPPLLVERDSIEVSVGHTASPSFKGKPTQIVECTTNPTDEIIAFILILFPLSLIAWIIGLYVHIKKRKHHISIFSDAKVQLQIAEKGNIIGENKSIDLSLSKKDDSIRLIYDKFNRWRQVNCFIAGSTKLQSERDAIRSSISIACNRWSSKKFQILSYTYEDFDRKFINGGQQSLYDTFITNYADYAIFIIKGEIGDFTISEFDKAYSAFKNRGKPSIVVYNHCSVDESESAHILRDRVKAIKQYWIDYYELNEMRMHFLDMISTELFNMFEKELGE